MWLFQKQVAFNGQEKIGEAVSVGQLINYPVINLFAVNNRAHRCSFVYIVTFSPPKKISSKCLFIIKKRKKKKKGVSPQSITNRMFKIKGCSENSHRREFHTGMTLISKRVYMMTGFISRYLKVHFMLIKYTRDSKSQTLRMRYPFQSTGRPTSHRNGWSFTWYSSEILYRSEILAPVQEPWSTQARVTRAGMAFCGGIV